MNETYQPNFSKAVRLFLRARTSKPLKAFRKPQAIKQTPFLIVPLVIGLIFTGTGSLYAQSPMASATAGTAAMQANTMRIGVVAAVNGGVKVASSGLAGRNVQSGEPIYIGDEVRTGENGRLQVLLLDETVFTIGPNSAIVIDEFIYNPATDDGIVKARILEGVFRFITGKIAHKEPKNMEIRMPVGTIGVRGTMVSGRVSGGQSFVVLNGPGPRSTGGRPGSIVVRNEITSGDSTTVHQVEVNRPTFHTIVKQDVAPTPPAPTPQFMLDSLNHDLGPQRGTSRQQRQGDSSDDGSHDGSEPTGPRGDSAEQNEFGDRNGMHPMMRRGDDGHMDGPPSADHLNAMAEAGVISPDQLTIMMADLNAWNAGDESTQTTLMNKYEGTSDDPHYNMFSLEDDNFYNINDDINDLNDTSNDSAQDNSNTALDIANGITTKAQITSAETGTGQFHFNASGPFIQTHDNFGTEYSVAKEGTVTVKLNLNFDFGNRSFGGGNSEVSIDTVTNGGSISAISSIGASGFNSSGGDFAVYSPVGTNPDIVNTFKFINSGGIIANKLDASITYDGSQGKGAGSVGNVPRQPGSL